MATYLAFFAAGDFAVAAAPPRACPGTSRSRSSCPRREHEGRRCKAARDARDIVRLARPASSAATRSPHRGPRHQPRPRLRPGEPDPPDLPAAGRLGHRLLVHELAHQWFGDSVSVHHWRDIWLNEGVRRPSWRCGGTRPTAAGAPSVAARRLRDIAAGDDFWDLAIGDPGPAHIFDGAGLLPRRRWPSRRCATGSASSDFWRTIRTWLHERAGATARPRTSTPSPRRSAARTSRRSSTPGCSPAPSPGHRRQRSGLTDRARGPGSGARSRRARRSLSARRAA